MMAVDCVDVDGAYTFAHMQIELGAHPAHPAHPVQQHR